jgi:hypothetical protein
MPLQAVLDVIVGTAYVYFFFSLLASSINEWYARLVNRRATLLRSFMPELLSSKRDAATDSLVAQFDKHPLIAGLKTRYAYPSYIPSMHVALALIDLAIQVTPGGAGVAPTLAVRATINGTTTPVTPDERRLLEALIAEEHNIRVVQARIEKWFTDSAERLSGEYKRRTTVSLLLIALALSFAFGVDSITLVMRLYNDPVLREAALNAARQATPTPTTLPPMPVPFGWGQLTYWFVPGCIITALAVTLGAPFWFDFLCRFVNLRQTGTPPGAQRPFSG